MKRLAALVTMAKVAQFFKCSFVWGSYTMFFSLSNCVLPLAGALAGSSGVITLAIMRLLSVLLFHHGALSILQLTQGIPSFFAGSYWVLRKNIFSAIIPVLCMILFIAHPTGAHAALYTIYWWVPIILYFRPTDNLFMSALGSTLTAHAVGSVLWLYTTPMPAQLWLGLLPIVAIERLFFASGMVVIYHTYLSAIEQFKRVSSALKSRIA